ncbi:MAG: hypothetical protein H6733_06850 [Alphaproteobacteria bacterium]|nr:hypothetical protein [Alphaproteobacteria bacterium]
MTDDPDDVGQTLWPCRERPMFVEEVRAMEAAGDVQGLADAETWLRLAAIECHLDHDLTGNRASAEAALSAYGCHGVLFAGTQGAEITASLRTALERALDGGDAH